MNFEPTEEQRTRIKEKLVYSPNSGIIYWRKNRKQAGMASFDRAGYLALMVDYKRYLAHRVAFFLMTDKWPTLTIDHINGIKHDNRWINLRECTSAQNVWNRQGTERGVHYHKRFARWQAIITTNGIRTYLGRFKTYEEAKLAYDKAAKLQRGDFHV